MSHKHNLKPKREDGSPKVKNQKKMKDKLNKTLKNFKINHQTLTKMTPK